MNTEQEREAFERHWHDFYKLGTKLARINGRYLSMPVQCAWEAWQAALASPEVQALREALRWTAGALQASCVAGKVTEADTARALIGNETKSIGQILDAADAALAAMEKQK